MTYVTATVDTSASGEWKSEATPLQTVSHSEAVRREIRMQSKASFLHTGEEELAMISEQMVGVREDMSFPAAANRRASSREDDWRVTSFDVTSVRMEAKITSMAGG